MKNSGKTFLSMIMLAGFLPVMMWLVIGQEKFTLLTRADAKNELRVWVEPAELIMAVGQSYEFKIMAESENENVLIPKIDLNLSTDEGLFLDRHFINYQYAFGGKQQIGEVIVEANNPGNFNVNIIETSVVTGLTDLPVKVAPAVVFVQ